MTTAFTTQTMTDDEGLFEQIDAEGSARCTVCGSIDSVRTDEYPGMYAGTESTETCGICGSWEGSGDPFKGTRRIQRRNGARLMIPHGDVVARLIARNGFLYPDVDEHDEANYETDPVSLLDVTVGERVTVTDVARRGAGTFTVTEIARDQWGLRFWGQSWEGPGLHPSAPFACTVSHRVARAV